MFNSTSCDYKKYLFLSASILILSMPALAHADGELDPMDIEGEVTAVDDSTIIYGHEFINQQSGMVTAVDLINRIPGGSSFLNQNNNGGGQRGFSSNDDPILINGHRISGKSNSSRDALSRIGVDQILRIEVIRGSSPDIKVSSQGALLNVVLHADAGGSGSWSARANYMAGKLSGEAEASYSGKQSFVDYSFSVTGTSFANIPVRSELLFDGAGVLLFDKIESLDRIFQRAEISTNMTLNLNNGDDININALFGTESFDQTADGDLLSPDSSGSLTVAGKSIFEAANRQQNWEIGMDYDTNISDNWQLKLIVLHSQRTDDNTSSEDYEIVAGAVQNDFETVNDVFRSENVGRAALVWSPSQAHRLEFGTELAFNERTTDFTLLNLEDGVLVRDDLASTLVTIKEVRDESFAIHSWQINEKLSLDSAIKFEYSKLTQSGNLDNSRNFTFVKPSWDIRYNITAKDQFQFSARREVSQLNFRHFASSLNGDNEIVGGNENLAPEKSWIFETSYEHRLDNDMGFIKPSVSFERFSNKLNRILLSPGVSGVGNANEATNVAFGIEGALRLYFIGMPQLQLSGDVQYKVTEIDDPFTGIEIPLNGRRTSPEAFVKLRHDVPEYGFLWEVQANILSDFEFRDLNEYSLFRESHVVMLEAAFEKEVVKGLILRVSYDNILNPSYGRDRYYYENGRAGGDLTSLEEREMKFNRQVFVTLKGTF